MGMMLLGIVGIIMFFINKKNISIDNDNKIVNTGIVKTMFTNKGILFYFVITFIMIILSTAKVI